MSEKDEIQRNGRINRRKFLTGVGAGTTAAVAGCGGNNPTDTPGGQETPEDTPEDTPTDTPSGPVDGGRPIEAMDTPPTTLNPLTASTTYEFEVIDKIYDYGTTVHPDDYSFTAWSIQDWELNPDNIAEDPDNPAITANLRDDLTFNDGEAVTAEDFKFSIDYITEQQPGGSITAAPFASVDEVQVDSPDGTTVNIFMTAKDNRWFTGILGTILLPQHIWSNVSDHTEYAPRNASEGVVGSGPFVLDDFSWENWFELSFRPNDQIPWPSADYVDWIHDDAPFLDGVRVEIFGSRNAKEQALLNGDVDCVGVQGISVDKAVQAQQDESLEVHQTQEAGYNHTSVNVRRVPLDDVAFRQLLRKLMDGDWIVEDFYKGIGAVKGDYASIAAFENWRPPAPTEADDYEGIPLPDLEFPGEPGTFQMNEEAVQAARDFLTNHPEAKHDYSFGEAQSSITTAPDGQELYVNGQHVNEAHTDNFGEAGQGPLVFSFQPPQEDLAQSRAGQRFLGALKAVGIPVQPKVKTINAQIPTIYAQEDFDIYSMGWGLGVNQTHLSALYSSEQSDLGYSDPDSEPTSTPQNNPMGYTGADELIFEDVETLLPEDRRPIVKQILAQIWNDAPTIITEYSNLLEPTNKRYTGYIEQVGGILSNSSWLNLRQNPEM